MGAEEAFDAQSYPSVPEAGLLAFELLHGFHHDVLIGMDIIGQCDVRDGSAALELP